MSKISPRGQNNNNDVVVLDLVTPQGVLKTNNSNSSQIKFVEPT